MTVINNSPQKCPNYAFYKDVAAAESAAETVKQNGINMDGYRYANIQVVPTPASGADPTAQVLWWSETLGEFIQEHTAISMAGAGANTPYEFTVECNGRIMLVVLTTMSSGTAKIYVSGVQQLTVG